MPSYVILMRCMKYFKAPAFYGGGAQGPRTVASPRRRVTGTNLARCNHWPLAGLFHMPRRGAAHLTRFGIGSCREPTLWKGLRWRISEWPYCSVCSASWRPTSEPAEGAHPRRGGAADHVLPGYRG